MTTAPLPQIALMLLEIILVSSILLLFFRLRTTFGLAPIYTMLGVFFQLANLWSATIYVRITPDIMVSPGSVVLFPASIFAVLFIYIREDAAEARKLIYALLATDFVGSLLSLMAVIHLRDPSVINQYHLPPELFAHLPWLDVVGSIALYADAILIILVYEFFARRFKNSLFIPIYLSITLVLWFDTIFFVTGSFFDKEAYKSILLSGLLGKSVSALIYSLVLSTYLSKFDVVAPGSSEEPALGDLFEVLTYRQKYEAMKIQATRDGLTNIYNRAFFDDVLASELALSYRSGRPLSLLMIDVDFFKQINDTYGHAEGDRALTLVANALQSIVRQSDYLCRYGGEEFAVILPGSDLDQAIGLAQRLCAEVPKVCVVGPAKSDSKTDDSIGAEDITIVQDDKTDMDNTTIQSGANLQSAATANQDSPQERRITATIGVASCPLESTSADGLIKLADARLYQGKQAGRNRVVPAELSEAVLIENHRS